MQSGVGIACTLPSARGLRDLVQRDVELLLQNQAGMFFPLDILLPYISLSLVLCYIESAAVLTKRHINSDARRHWRIRRSTVRSSNDRENVAAVD
jgi:hypothetical protein